MSNWRAVLVLVLVLLLPWRSSVAALLHCFNHQPTVASTVAQHAATDAHDAHGVHDALSPAADSSPNIAATDSVDESAVTSTHSSMCDMQTHGCCVSVGISGPPAVSTLWAIGPVHFPPLLLPALTFEWAAQERPPRHL